MVMQRCPPIRRGGVPSTHAGSIPAVLTKRTGKRVTENGQANIQVWRKPRSSTNAIGTSDLPRWMRQREASKAICPEASTPVKKTLMQPVV